MSVVTSSSLQASPLLRQHYAPASSPLRTAKEMARDPVVAGSRMLQKAQSATDQLRSQEALSTSIASCGSGQIVGYTLCGHHHDAEVRVTDFDRIRLGICPFRMIPHYRLGEGSTSSSLPWEGSPPRSPLAWL